MPPAFFSTKNLDAQIQRNFMNKPDVIRLTAFVIFFVSAIIGFAQTQTVTLTATNGAPSSYNLSTNQVIIVNSFVQTGGVTGTGIAAFWYNNGLKSQIGSYAYGLNQAVYSSQGGIALAFIGNAVFTGVTNISVTCGSGAVVSLTLTISTPTVQSSVPANTVVIPTDATGSVQIVLESSGDLVNWTSSMPGTYGSTYTNRFFRVRAIAQ